jgi:hypothetical protein
MQSDIELAITGLGEDQRETLVRRIPRAYTVEDRSATGYGLVVRSESSEGSEDISTRLESFLRSLLPIVETIKDRDCILRVAIFSSLATTTTTFSFSCLEVLRRFNAKLEVSVYPLDDESV